MNRTSTAASHRETAPPADMPNIVRVYQGPNRRTMVGSLAAICTILETRCRQQAVRAAA